MDANVGNEKDKSPRISGISRAALALGVSREHLRAVISGKKSRPELLARYQALKTTASMAYSTELQSRIIEKIQETAALVERMADAQSVAQLQASTRQVAAQVDRITGNGAQPAGQWGPPAPQQGQETK